ncbi:hypothetical protein [Rhodoferax sp. UBA5149]|uniref:hypothetical protein n=1 Tax=Rhodoferax sp. UBA5149 TaxID=1947379 RepID=UPI0025E96F40|nr:hypothetical protein [Rhodoferax sp. UBA5149]
MQKQDRLHALDAVRAFALLLGIAFHATLLFIPGIDALGFPWRISGFFICSWYCMFLFSSLQALRCCCSAITT